MGLENAYDTDVHFPTDINLLWDAVRKVLTLTHRLSSEHNLSGWRQTKYNVREIKKLFRRVQKERDRNKKSCSCLAATRHYLDECARYFNRASDTILLVGGDKEIRRFINHGKRQISQIYRRCFLGKSIDPSEKVYSLFEAHTEWIVKGKAGIAQELGVRVCIVQSEHGFILHHRIMEHESEKDVALPIVKETKRLYKGFSGCSFDKGFHSPENQKDLKTILDTCVLPKKGKLSGEQRAWQQSDEFKRRRCQHAAVESAISALENHSLDRCCDFGLDGFCRYVALAIIARNIQLLGSILQQQELKKLDRQRKKKAA